MPASGFYWIIDPREPSLTPLRLVDGRFTEQAKVDGAKTYRSTDPVAVDVTPADLLRPAGS